MKKIILGSILSLSSISYAGFLPITTCSNAHSDILFLIFRDGRPSKMTVMTSKYPTPQYENFDLKDLAITETLLQTMPTKTKGNSESTTTFKEIKVEKLDGSAMPDAYGKTAEKDGSLQDYVICDTTRVWLT